MDEALVLCRFLHFAAAVLLFGISVFQEVVAPRALARAISRPLRQLAAAGIVIVFLTTIVWLLLAAGEMGDGWAESWNPVTLADVLFDTYFGQVWQWHLGFAVILLGVLTTGRHDRWRVTAFLSGLVLGSLGFVGHAAMHPGALGWANCANQTLHLVAAGAWLGSLFPLLICLRLQVHPNVAVALHRFHYLGYVAVVTVVTTGIVNSWLVLGTWPIDVSSPYQSLLLAKIVCVAAMVGLAVANRYVLVPRLWIRPGALRLLRWNTLAEIVLGLSVIALVSTLGTLAPV